MMVRAFSGAFASFGLIMMFGTAANGFTSPKIFLFGVSDGPIKSRSQNYLSPVSRIQVPVYMSNEDVTDKKESAWVPLVPLRILTGLLMIHHGSEGRSYLVQFKIRCIAKSHFLSYNNKQK